MVDGFEGNGEGGKWLSFTHEEEGKLVDGFEGNGEGGKWRVVGGWGEIEEGGRGGKRGGNGEVEGKMGKRGEL